MAKGKKTGGKNFAFGNNANPNGRPRVPEDVKIARRLTREEFIRLVNDYLSMTKDEIRAATANPDTPVLSLMIASLVSKAVVDGDQHRMNFILDRMIGKVPQPIIAQVDPELMEAIEHLKDKPDKDLIEIVDNERVKSLK